MARYSSILQAIGNTPLIRLNSVARTVESPIYVKAEFLNPGGSIKDRIGRTMIEAAEREGLLRPGGTIIEATAGNTGVGLAQAAAIRGYRCIFVLPDKMSVEKVNLLRAYGAEVVITPTAVAPDSPESYNGVADRLAREIPGAFRPNQFFNPNNPLAHYLTTGPEIWDDSEGKIEVLVAGMGTGGTISGTARYLKERNPDILVVGADPEGSILSGDSPRSYKVEGIGEDFIPKTFDRQVIDDMVRVNDGEAFRMARRLAREEGILAGGSSGTAVAAAIRYARRLETPRFIVALLPDTGRNYLNKIYSDSWMAENGFLDREEEPAVTVGEVLERKRNPHVLVAAVPGDPLDRAIRLMRDHEISQIPVLEGGTVVGSLNEAAVMKLLHDGIDYRTAEVGPVMGKPLPVLDENVHVTEAFRVLLTGTTGIVITRKGTPSGILTRADLIGFWAQQREAV